jgi:hypothetical protein
MSISHPYEKYEHLEVWKVISQGLADLEANGDIEQKTASVYIVGYLSKLLGDEGLIPLGRSSPNSKSSVRKQLFAKGLGSASVKVRVRKPARTTHKAASKKKG